MIEHYCFVCNRPVAPEDRVERSFPNHGGVWVFVMHKGCRDEFERTIPRRFHEMALSALGHPQR